MGTGESDCFNYADLKVSSNNCHYHLTSSAAQAISEAHYELIPAP